MMFQADVCIVGGAGHVGLPLALTMVISGLKVIINDTDGRRVSKLLDGHMPFEEEGCDLLLQNQLVRERLSFNLTPNAPELARTTILCLPTDLDPKSNNMQSFNDIVKSLGLCMKDAKQVVLVRSTVAPGGVEAFTKALHASAGWQVPVGFVPERLLQGKALAELRSLPQIVSGSAPARARARELFSFANGVIELPVDEAEVLKLFTNAYRSAMFGLGNEFYLTALKHRMNYPRLRRAMMASYPRMAAFPLPGFVGGPCLPKDAAALLQWDPEYMSGVSGATYTNKWMAVTIYGQILKGFPNNEVVGLLGLTFKADSDDTRGSLAIELRDLLLVNGFTVVGHDPYIPSVGYTLSDVLDKSSIIIVGAPHTLYKGLIVKQKKLVIDPTNILNVQP